MRKVIDRRNMRYGKLVVIDYYKKDTDGVHWWRCKCDCGNETIISSKRLSSQPTKSCGCLHNKAGSNRERVILAIYYSKLKNRNYEKGFSDLIDIESFKNIILQPCTYCGIEFSRILKDIQSKGNNKNIISDYTLKCNGIDRIDSRIGYTKENCAPCCTFCNNAKNIMSENDFYLWIKKVYDHSNLAYFTLEKGFDYD